MYIISNVHPKYDKKTESYNIYENVQYRIKTKNNINFILTTKYCNGNHDVFLELCGRPLD